MQAEIIAVGTEMLLGQIVDTNGPFMARQLADLGINLYTETIVGDNPERLEEAIQLADSRSQLTILIGGLGPTKDDLTKQTVAKHLGVDLMLDETAMKQIAAHFKQAQREMTPNNWVQAQVPAGATVLPNTIGLAVGGFSEKNGHGYLILPGPPREFEPMVTQFVRPLLAKTYHPDEEIISRVLRFYGIGESRLATELADLIDQQQNPTIAPYIKADEVTLRLTARAHTDAEAKKLLDQTEQQIQARIGQYFYGYGDDNSLAQVVVTALKAQHVSITAAESLTAGLFQATIGSIPGASEIFNGGFVTYALAAKASLLDIPTAQLEHDGVVSAETAIAMARQSKAKMNSDIGISFTGVAGPDELEGHPAGTVYIGLAFKNQEPVAQLYHFSGGRNDVRRRSVMSGLSLILRALQAENK
ncbi:competence damage-inducible protein A [Lactobacillus selangorensis]|uniref:Putative competence-damage inducible protein n=1 Tax=Lactobacillus selangorensis TaxID=81857 RepID=A0A0R2FIT9_9LACO|nr:competence/damage-inducible protein A [Lactobacillus selangorensis]KRN28464.1 competence damage-inducible protein A [Lactobacillus selangorensis]KRN31965.1 competence damage-inducible protein A [Lactobacillus selangorensis]